MISEQPKEDWVRSLLDDLPRRPGSQPGRPSFDRRLGFKKGNLLFLASVYPIFVVFNFIYSTRMFCVTRFFCFGVG